MVVEDRKSDCSTWSFDEICNHPSDLLTKAIASPSKFAKFQAVLLGEQKATASATALVAKSAVRGAEARCFLVRPL